MTEWTEDQKEEWRRILATPRMREVLERLQADREARDKLSALPPNPQLSDVAVAISQVQVLEMVLSILSEPWEP